MKRIFLSFAVFVLFLAIWGIYVSSPNFKSLTVGGRIFEVEIADDPIEQKKGLSQKLSLAENQGMLFVFDGLDTRNFWMAGMKFPLDLIWIKGDKVIGVSENLPPAKEGSAEIYSSPEPVDRVLEINAGLVKKLSIQIGDHFSFEEDETHQQQ